MSRPFSAALLRRSPSFRRLTGISVMTFDRAVAGLTEAWDKHQAQKLKSGRPSDLGGLDDHLLVLLIYYRCYVTQEFLGFFYHVNKSAICRAIQRVEGLAHPLIGVGRKPKVNREEAEALIVDCTEQPIQRPGTDARQREHYSGKKKRHTMKTEYVVTAKGRIAAVSASHPGSHHDLTIRRKAAPLPKRARAYVDSGYQGYDKDHAKLEFPYKKPKKGALSAEEKEYNRGLSSFRVRVEHRIGRVKRYKIVSERFRNPLKTHGTRTSIVAGLVNLEDGFGPF
jgi:hypothetical protein